MLPFAANSINSQFERDHNPKVLPLVVPLVFTFLHTNSTLIKRKPHSSIKLIACNKWEPVVHIRTIASSLVISLIGRKASSSNFNP